MRATKIGPLDRKSTRLNSSHLGISYAVFCLKKTHEEKRPLDQEIATLTADAKQHAQGNRALEREVSALRKEREDVLFFLNKRASPGNTSFPPHAALPS